MATSPAPSGRGPEPNVAPPYSPPPPYPQRAARPAPDPSAEIERLRLANRRLLRLLGYWQYNYEWAMRIESGQTYGTEIQAHLDHYLHEPYLATISLLSQEGAGGD